MPILLLTCLAILCLPCFWLMRRLLGYAVICCMIGLLVAWIINHELIPEPSPGQFTTIRGEGHANYGLLFGTFR
jgi:hypothetical protein